MLGARRGCWGQAVERGACRRCEQPRRQRGERARSQLRSDRAFLAPLRHSPSPPLHWCSFIWNFLLYTTTPRIAAAVARKDEAGVSAITAQVGGGRAGRGCRGARPSGRRVASGACSGASFFSRLHTAICWLIHSRRAYTERGVAPSGCSRRAEGKEKTLEAPCPLAPWPPTAPSAPAAGPLAGRHHRPQHDAATDHPVPRHLRRHGRRARSGRPRVRVHAHALPRLPGHPHVRAA